STSPNSATSFTVQRSVDGGAFATLGTAFATNYADTTVTSGHTYAYRVYAADAIGPSLNPTNISTAQVPAAGAHTIDYSGGFTTANTTPGSTHGGFQFNGATQATLVTGNLLQLTTNAGNQARSVWYTYPSDPTGRGGKMYIASFSTTFVYNLASAGNGPADGVTFTIQNSSSGLSAIGAAGGSLAYAGISPSVALGINVYGGNALGTEIMQNGVVDENFTETNINTQTVNAPITITITYAAGVLTVTETQTRGGTVFTDTKSLAINLPQLLQTDYAYVGFTGATGGANSTQNINSWTFDQGAVPVPPTGLTGTLTGYTGGAVGTVPTPVPMAENLTWAAVTDTPAAGGTVTYKILRALSAAGPYTQIGTSTTNSYPDSGLATNTTYYYKVQATDPYGDSFPSTSFSVTTPNLAATPNGSQTTNVTATSISFQWNDVSNNENGYLILRRTGGSGTFLIVANLPANSTSYTDNGLSPGTTYDYHIQSYNLAGYSDFAGVTDTTLSATTSTALSSSANPVAAATPVTFTATVTSAGGTPTGTVQFYDGSILLTPTPVPVNASGVATYTTSFGGGVHPITAVYSGAAFFSGSTSPAVTEIVNGPTEVEVAQVADGSAQRSAVRSFTVTFSSQVTFLNGNATAAFQLARTGPTGPTGNVGLSATVTTDAQGRTVVTLTFSGPFTESNTAAGVNPSLIDGIYTLTVLSGNVTGANGLALDGNNDGIAGGDFALATHRLFGDVDGDGDVDLLDLNPLVPALFGVFPQPNYNPAFDFEGDGDVDLLDLNQFVQRLFLSGYTP
ncbi:MAG TPA: Ig-like domain repeat protein, partial [Gemmataceae bacterium]